MGPWLQHYRKDGCGGGGSNGVATRTTLREGLTCEAASHHAQATGPGKEAVITETSKWWRGF